MVKMLTVLVSTISNSHVFLLEKCEQLLQMLLTNLSAKILAYMPYLISFNYTLTDDIISFEQLGPGRLIGH